MISLTAGRLRTEDVTMERVKGASGSGTSSCSVSTATMSGNSGVN
jgi:hypothetical protein